MLYCCVHRVCWMVNKWKSRPHPMVQILAEKMLYCCMRPGPKYIDQPKKTVEAQPKSPRSKPGLIPKKRQWGVS
uniref:Uncharacterized protein n=1 Tax=Psilocybe cubensis TaxID=181762 RepID=A0A8H7XMV2_PSICU